MKRILLKSLLSAAMLMTGTSAFAYDFVVDGIYYDITSETDLTVAVTYESKSYSTYSGDVVIPSTVTNGDITYSVTSIGARAFYSSTEMTSVSLPESVATLGNYAFYNCSALQTLAIPSAVTAIPNYLCQGCTGLKSFTVADNITSIGNYAFRDCTGLESITIGNAVEKLGSNALFGCSSLTTVNLPASVSSIGTNAFGMNYMLTDINVAEDNATYTSIDGVVYNKEVTQIVCCPGAKASVTLPETLTEIPNYAFRECGELTSITIPDQVTSIGQYAFRECTKLATATLGSSVATLGNNAFYGCTSLGTIYCLGTTPSTGKDNAFPTDIYTTATVYVPEGTVDSYKAVLPWSGFTNIETNTATAIVNMSADNGVKVVSADNGLTITGASADDVVNVYGVNGSLMYSGHDTSVRLHAAGVYIVKVAGKSYKVVVK